MSQLRMNTKVGASNFNDDLEMADFLDDQMRRIDLKNDMKLAWKETKCVNCKVEALDYFEHHEIKVPELFPAQWFCCESCFTENHNKGQNE